MEKDDEVSGTGNTYTTHFRAYDARLGRWFSTDPLVQFVGSQYSSFANNPIKLTGWVPKVKKETKTETNDDGTKTETTTGYLTAEMEKGDNAKSLAKFLNVSKGKAKEIYKTKDKDGVIKLPNDIAGAINKAIQHSIDNPEMYDDDWYDSKNYNCYASAIYTSQGLFPLEGDKTTNQKYLKDRDYFLRLQKSDYENVSSDPNKITFGKTLIRLAENRGLIFKSNFTVHGAIFLGKSRDGTEYVWTKNGWNVAPKVMTLSGVLQVYKGSFIQGVGPTKNEGGYYNFTGN